MFSPMHATGMMGTNEAQHQEAAIHSVYLASQLSGVPISVMGREEGLP